MYCLSVVRLHTHTHIDKTWPRIFIIIIPNGNRRRPIPMALCLLVGCGKLKTYKRENTTTTTTYYTYTFFTCTCVISFVVVVVLFYHTIDRVSRLVPKRYKGGLIHLRSSSCGWRWWSIAQRRAAPAIGPDASRDYGIQTHHPLPHNRHIGITTNFFLFLFLFFFFFKYFSQYDYFRDSNVPQGGGSCFYPSFIFLWIFFFLTCTYMIRV
jgi:hypothetical protein